MGRHVGDFPLSELKTYKPKLVSIPADFEQFWQEKKAEVSRSSIKVDIAWKQYCIASVEWAAVTLHSWDRTPLKGMLIRPKGMEEGPVLLHFHGYTGNKGLPVDFLKWVLLGITVISFDVRGQGDSPDFARYENGSRIPGWMLSGILDKEGYYYTNVYKDLMTQLLWIKNDAPIRPTKIGVHGSSQGGGLALVAAALDEDVSFVVSDWPFITHFERALDVALSGPYMEIVQYFKLHDPQLQTYETVMNTLSYIDVLYFCPQINVPVFMAIGLEDPITPPSTVFAAFHHLNSKEKKLEIYPHFVHEVNPFHEEKKIEFIYQQFFL
jgi:cephalosporin-C deacetylase